MPSTLDPQEILTRLFGSVSRARILHFLVSHAGRTFYQREIMFETGRKSGDVVKLFKKLWKGKVIDLLRLRERP